MDGASDRRGQRTTLRAVRLRPGRSCWGTANLEVAKGRTTKCGGDRTLSFLSSARDNNHSKLPRVQECVLFPHSRVSRDFAPALGWRRERPRWRDAMREGRLLTQPSSLPPAAAAAHASLFAFTPLYASDATRPDRRSTSHCRFPGKVTFVRPIQFFLSRSYREGSRKPALLVEAGTRISRLGRGSVNNRRVATEFWRASFPGPIRSESRWS